MNAAPNNAAILAGSGAAAAPTYPSSAPLNSSGTGLTLDAPRRMLWPVTDLIVGESLMSLFVRTISDNVHVRVAPLLEAVGLPHHRAFDLALRADLQADRLAAVLRLDVREVESRRHQPMARPAGPPMVSFSAPRFTVEICASAGAGLPRLGSGCPRTSRQPPPTVSSHSAL